MHSLIRSAVIIGGLGLTSAFAMAAVSKPASDPAAPIAHSDSAEVVEAVNKYHAALSKGDSAAALALLAMDATILESGAVETRAEYRSHHLAGDIAFAKAVASVRGPLRVSVAGTTAWTSGTSTTQGTYNGRAINSAGAESMVLTKEASGWKIRAIHWSSRTRRPPAS